MSEITMQKLNTLGQAPSQAKYCGGQIINVTYGHNGSGKLYSYIGQNKRTGDIVTPEVTHPKSGKTYKTLAVVRSTHSLKNGQDTVNYLDGRNIKMKTIGKTDQKSLPGYYQGWDKDAKAIKELQNETLLRYDIPMMQKLNLMNQIPKLRK